MEDSHKTSETRAIFQEKQKNLSYKIIINDAKPESMIALTALKNIFQRQLPQMPKEYIGRLIYDR